MQLSTASIEVIDKYGKRCICLHVHKSYIRTNQWFAAFTGGAGDVSDAAKGFGLVGNINSYDIILTNLPKIHIVSKLWFCF